MRTLLKLSTLIDTLTERLGSLNILLVLLTIAIGAFNPISRYVGSYLGVKLTSNAFLELQWYLYSMIFFLGFAYVLKHGINVRVDFLYTNWSPKAKAWVDLIGTVFFLIPFCLLGLYVTWNPVLISWGRLPDGTFGNWELSPDPEGLPRAPIKSFILVSFSLLLLQAISQAIKYSAIILGDRAVVQAVVSSIETDVATGATLQ
ncbi:MAG: TRAP transporter small permease subunit [Anaerolineales bacterium]|nr:TRAP transporter small permease subunit [Anaerolineales bacterium]